ncbi:hypothetical protein [Flavobacterium pedocola]
MKNIIVLFQSDSINAQKYDKIWDDLRAAGQSEPNGLLHHVGGPTANGFTVVDVWESEEHFNEFGKILFPILEKNGVSEMQPTITPLHYMYTGHLAEHDH